MTSVRINIVKYIKDNIVNIDEDDIDNIYNKINQIIPNKIKKKGIMIRAEKILYIESMLRLIDIDVLEEIKENIEEKINYVETEEDKKSRITLEIINKILVANNITRIKKLTDFISIRRDVMLTDESINIVNENKEYIFDNGFDKTGCKVYHTYIKSPHLSIIKGMLKEIGYEIKSKVKSKQIDKISEKFMVYTIIKTE
jgi:hypothetical protein